MEDKQAHMSFLREMTDALKQAAPKQLVLIGSEGFFAQDDPNSAFNPGGRWWLASVHHQGGT